MYSCQQTAIQYKLEQRKKRQTNCLITAQGSMTCNIKHLAKAGEEFIKNDTQCPQKKVISPLQFTKSSRCFNTTLKSDA